MPFPQHVSTRGWAYWLVYPPERRMLPKVKRFREWLLSEIPDSARLTHAEQATSQAAE